MAWQYHNPVRVSFANGAFQQLHRAIDGRHYGLVTYPEGYFGDLARELAQQAGAPTILIDDVDANPDFNELAEQCARIGKTGQPEVWIALGGGSVIDSAKVFAASAGNFSNVRTYLETGKGARALSQTPIIAVPTTAGTGSEVTCWATLWDRQADRKYSLARTNLYPEQAIIDPQLMCGKPRELTISTGLDALSHALESLWNINANPISATYAVSAAREVLQTLPLLATDLTNLELRTHMARAALFAGLAFSNTRTAIAHSLSYPITLRHKVPHGIACSFSLPMVIESLKGTGGLCEASLRSIFDGDLDGAAGQLRDVLTQLGISTEPTSHGLSAEEWSEIVTAAMDGERGKNFIGDKTRFMAVAAEYSAATP